MAVGPCGSPLRTGVATSLFLFHHHELQASAQGRGAVDWTPQTGGRPEDTLSVCGRLWSWLSWVQLGFPFLYPSQMSPHPSELLHPFGTYCLPSEADGNLSTRIV